MNIKGQMEKVSLLVHSHRLESPLEETTHPFIFSVEIHCITGTQFLHESNDSSLPFLSDEKMIVVRHKSEE